MNGSDYLELAEKGISPEDLFDVAEPEPDLATEGGKG